MRRAIDLVKASDAHACVSAGNTGALMATAHFVLKMLPGVERPAIVSLIPSRGGHTYMLDLGANASCTPVVVNVSGHSVREYAGVIEQLPESPPSQEALHASTPQRQFIGADAQGVRRRHDLGHG